RSRRVSATVTGWRRSTSGSSSCSSSAARTLLPACTAKPGSTICAAATRTPGGPSCSRWPPTSIAPRSSWATRPATPCSMNCASGCDTTMFEFAWPLCFVLLPLPWLFRRLLPAASTRSAALQVSFMNRLQELQTLSPEIRSAGRKWPHVIVWVLLVIAAARPQWLGDPLPTASSGRDMMLAVDLSGSMEFRDMQLDGREVSRLTMVKELLAAFIAGRRGDRLGLVLFGSQAYVQAPLTHDRDAI